MRIWVGLLLGIAVVACKKEPAKPDVTKLPAEEACRVISKRAFECKDTIIARARATMTKAGASAHVIDLVSDKLGQPNACEGVTDEAIDQLRTCYDPDCDKLAACYDAMLTESLRPAGGSREMPDPAAAHSATPQ